MSDSSLSTLPGIKRKTDICFDTSDSSSDSIETFGRMSPLVQRVEKEMSTDDNVYGLKPSFLKSLGITPPFDQWIHITNFRCDKWELREVLELAGHVIICSVIAIRERYAKAMYSHPLEAIQAVSMLNGQTFFGQKLKITMVLCPSNTIILPKGLSNLGPGFGVGGKPLRNIAEQYQKFINNQKSLVDPILFTDLTKGNSIKKEEESTDFKRIMSLQVISVEAVQESEESVPPTKKPKIDSFNNSPLTNSDSVESNNNKSVNETETKDKSADGIPLTSSDTQPDRPFRNLTVIPIDTSSSSVRPARPAGPCSQATPISVPPGFNTNPPAAMGAMNPRMNVRPMGTQNFNMAGPMYPRMAFPPGSQGVNMVPPGPQGIMMNPVGAQRIPGPVPMNMNIPPSGYGPPHVAQPNPFIPQGMGVIPKQVSPAPTPPQSSYSVQFTNLPPSTTFPILCEKVSLCGQVLSLQFTTPGCAIAQFSLRAHAERCFQTFNGLRIDGFVVEVRYI